jgi:sulfate transport system permease protein
MPHEFSSTPQIAMKHAQQDPAWVRYGLIGLVYLVIGVLIVVPLINVFYMALADGVKTYFEHLTEPDTLHAIKLTLSVAPCVVFLNTIFGVAAAWLLTRFNFPGRAFITSLIDLPFAISPVVAALMYMLLFGLQGFWGKWLSEHNFPLVFNFTGIVLITTFVTLPFVARELIPLMEAIGSDEEIAAISLGANGWQTFWRITLPNIKWGLLFGIILCNARAMGEYGAARVVSGSIGGQTDTMPLRVEKLFQDISAPQSASYAVASLLTLLSVVTLLLRIWLEHKTQAQIQQAKAAQGAES